MLLTTALTTAITLLLGGEALYPTVATTILSGGVVLYPGYHPGKSSKRINLV